jgi:hypothetical protein
MFKSLEYLADLEALKSRMAARAVAEKDEPFMVTTYRELTADPSQVHSALGLFADTCCDSQ